MEVKHSPKPAPVKPVVVKDHAAVVRAKLKKSAETPYKERIRQLHKEK